MLCCHLPYHNILNVVLHQVVLGGDQHRSAKGIQICIVQLVWQTINFVRCVHMDVSDWTIQKKQGEISISHCKNSLLNLNCCGFSYKH